MRRSSVHRLALVALLSWTSAELPSPAAARGKDDEREEEVDRLALGARLVADGHHDRALTVLKEIDPADEKVDRPKLHFLLGTIYANKELHNQAKDAFLASLAAGQQNRAIHLYLAQSYFALNDYRNTIRSLDQAGASGADNPGTATMRAEAHWRLKDAHGALRALDAGIARFPEFVKLFQMKVGYLIELGLYQEVARVGDTYLQRKSTAPTDYVLIAEGLRRSKQLHEARMIMERAQLRFPDELDVRLQLANIYNDLARPLTSAMLYEAAARSDAKYSFESAELYKQAGRPSRALSLNARVLDPQKKLKQRLAILIDMERYEMVAAMEPSLSRAGLIKDENIRYALAYGYFKNGDFESAEQHLKQLSGAQLFEKATALRKAMATCREAGWACY